MYRRQALQLELLDGQFGGCIFGQQLEQELREEVEIQRQSGPRNLLELLPDEFTLDDAKRVRMQEGMGTEKTIKMIRNWMNRGYVTQNSEFSFKKNRKN